jgi:hypothetical protein
MQLIEDRRQVVAQENAKLMSLMTNVSTFISKCLRCVIFFHEIQIMNEKRDQPKYVKPSSLNEMERKRQVDRLNFENKLMVQRLSKVRSVISNHELEESFKKHIKAEANLRRRQMKPLAIPKDLHPNSPLRNKFGEGGGSFDGTSSLSAGLFDSSLYTTQRGHHLNGNSLSSSNLLTADHSPIRNVTDFRKQVIATKKLQNNQFNSSENYSDSRIGTGVGMEESMTFSPNSSIHIGESKMSIESLPKLNSSSMKSNHNPHNNRPNNNKSSDSIYEITHIPER